MDLFVLSIHQNKSISRPFQDHPYIYSLMARILLICFILSHVLTFLATANNEIEPDRMHRMVRAGVEPKASNISDPPATSAPNRDKEDESDEPGIAPAPVPRKRKQHHHSTDKSVAGGGVIIGGLVAAFFATVFAYIRVTRRSRESSQSKS